MKKRAAEERRPIASLVPDPHNRRLRTARNLEMIRDSLRAVGPGRSIVIDEADEILAGNGVAEAAPGAGIEGVRIIEAEGNELIAIRRRGLSPEQKRALAIFDNRTAELAEWNVEQLRADQVAGLDLAPFFSTEELSAFFRAPDRGGLATGNLVEKFGVPPFSVLDARQGYWQDRKRAWLALGIQSELGRGADANPGGAPLPGVRGPRKAYRPGDRK